MDLTAIEASLRAAIGQRRTSEDLVVPALVERLAVTLESSLPVPRAGDVLPAGWHTIFCLKAPARAELGADGLAKGFDLIPPVPMQRRMFGGARARFQGPLVVGEPVRCESELIDAKVRTGPAGHLAIATLRLRYSGPAGLAVEEEQDIIHMEPSPSAGGRVSATPRPEPLPPVAWQRRVSDDPVMLFRFSALTFNSHRIHYDLPYCIEVEKIPGLIVQGKLIGLHLLETVRAGAPSARVTQFDYRSGRPLYAGRGCVLKAALEEAGARARVWAEDGRGEIVQTASITFERPVQS